jgi:hypothetical protein
VSRPWCSHTGQYHGSRYRLGSFPSRDVGQNQNHFWPSLQPLPRPDQGVHHDVGVVRLTKPRKALVTGWLMCTPAHTGQRHGPDFRHPQVRAWADCTSGPAAGRHTAWCWSVPCLRSPPQMRTSESGEGMTLTVGDHSRCLGLPPRGPRAHGPVAEPPGRSALRTTGRAGLRRATSRNPARSYIDFAPKNMKSGWLRSSLSTG